eukprot:gene17473-9082_t
MLKISYVDRVASDKVFAHSLLGHIIHKQSLEDPPAGPEEKKGVKGRPFWTISCRQQHRRFGTQPALKQMISADFAAMAILISFGAVLGIANSVQLLTIALLEALFYSINEGVCTTILYVSDNGKTFFVHVFGAVYGVVVARMLYRGRVFRNSGLLCSSYNSEVFTLIGTMFLWVYWPSFNSYGADDITRQRAMVNTFYALAASCVATFAFSVLSSSESKLHMGHIQNATLAGGVAIGSIAQMIIQPWGAVLMGLVASLISVIGYRYIQRKLERRFRIFDIRGVLAIHGFPGLLGAIASVIVTAMAKYGTYKTSLYRLYPAVTPTSNSTAYNELTQFEPDIPPGLNRSLGQQAAFQISGLFLSISVALLGGLITAIAHQLQTGCRLLHVIPENLEGFCETDQDDNIPDDASQTSKDLTRNNSVEWIHVFLGGKLLRKSLGHIRILESSWFSEWLQSDDEGSDKCFQKLESFTWEVFSSFSAPIDKLADMLDTISVLDKERDEDKFYLFWM